MRLIDIPHPETDEERHIKHALRCLQEEYQAKAKPWLDKLAEIQADRMPRYVMIPDDAEREEMAKRLPDWLQGDRR